MAYRLNRRAERDLRAIFVASVEQFGPEQAERYSAGLVRTFSFLSDFPEAARERSELRPPLRVYRYQSHLIFYRLVNRDIEVLRIRHGREDWLSDPRGPGD